MIKVELLKGVSLGGIVRPSGSVLSLPQAFGQQLIESGSAKAISEIVEACPACPPEPPKSRRSRKAENEGID